jgi:alkylated DNA nucleotide flippase Atl1
MKTKKSWQEKMKKPAEIQILDAPPKWRDKYGEKMLIPTPVVIKQIVQKIPQGKLTTVKTLREYMARKYAVDFACPLTTGIFLRIVAEATEENRQKNIEDNTPYWRVIKDDGTINPKFPGAYELQKQYLENENFTIVKKGRSAKFMVKDFQNFLMHITDFE